MIVFILAAVAIVCYIIKVTEYNKTSYKQNTGVSYYTAMHDKGRRGEYEIYGALMDYESRGYRFLFNVYLPKANGKTTEIDVIMIGPEGVYVFESKNYSGWIFGNDSQKYWTQVLRSGRDGSQKEHFYNPVWQNRTHCNTLKEYLPQDTPIYSLVLFSNRCEFKDVTVNSKDKTVAYRREVRFFVDQIAQNTLAFHSNVDQIYAKLFPYSQATSEVKQLHNDDISFYR